MGYTHSWGWADGIANAAKFVRWSKDVEQLHASYCENPPPNPFQDEPWSRFHPILFGEWDATIRGPYGDASPLFCPEMVAFNGNRATENECEPFVIRAKDLEYPHFFWCKTWGNPYDLLVTAALIRFEHHFPQVAIYCGGGAEGLDDASDLCQLTFGTGRNPLRDPVYCRFVDRVFSQRSA